MKNLIQEKAEVRKLYHKEMKKKPCATHWDCFTSIFWIRDDGNVEFAAPSHAKIV